MSDAPLIFSDTREITFDSRGDADLGGQIVLDLATVLNVNENETASRREAVRDAEEIAAGEKAARTGRVRIASHSWLYGVRSGRVVLVGYPETVEDGRYFFERDAKGRDFDADHAYETARDLKEER